MTFPELNKKFDNVVKDLTSNYNGTIMVRLGAEAKRMIFDRVHGTGTNAQGQKYAPYSTKPTLIGNKTFAFGYSSAAVLGSKPKRKLLEWRTVNGHRLAILPGGYKKIRELENRQTAFVDFSVTQRMWDNIGVIKHTNNSVTIGAKEQKEKDKLKGNTERRGEILDLSEKEIGILKNTYGLSVLQIFKNHGL